MKARYAGRGLLLGALLAGQIGAAWGALIDTGNGLVSDTTRNLIWTQDANLAAGNTFGLPAGTSLGPYPGDTSGYSGFIEADGTMNWPGARFWIDAMNAMNYKGYHDWRLPATPLPDPGCSDQYDPGGGFPLQGFEYQCTGSDLGHLFYVDGGLHAGDSITDSALLTAHFENMQADRSVYGYWSGTQYAPDQGYAYLFYTGLGYQTVYYKDGRRSVWAVRDADAGAAPIPATGLLMALGLLALGISRGPRRG